MYLQEKAGILGESYIPVLNSLRHFMTVPFGISCTLHTVVKPLLEPLWYKAVQVVTLYSLAGDILKLMKLNVICQQ